MRKKNKLYAKPLFAPYVQGDRLPALPFDAGASLSRVERYTDQRFRAVCKGRLPEARSEFKIQVAALLKILPVSHAKLIFHWEPRSVRYAKAMDLSIGDAMHKRNMTGLGLGHVLALVRAMREGGWTGKGTMPDIVKLGLREARNEGLTIKQIAELFDLDYWTVSYGFRVPHAKRMAKNKVGLVL